jgi:SAM-dependent methyltransferase
VPDSYTERIRQQLEQYADAKIHDLPEIAHFWSDAFIGPGMSEVFGTTSITELYANAYVESKGSKGGLGRILSIGCGDGNREIAMIELLLNRGHKDFLVVCTDLSPLLLDRLRTTARDKEYERLIEIAEVDLNVTPVLGEFDMIMANHSLHHIVELELLFKYCADHLKDEGILATNDMIGRNGHMRWPETALILEALWPTLTDREKWHTQLRRLHEGFRDHDCSNEGFEGIRAQDILPLLLQRFHPYRFHAFGGFIDVLVDRGYGHAYDPNVREHVAKIRFLSILNEILLDSGVIKPTIMMAYFTKTKGDRPEIYYRNRRARECVRNCDPRWLQFYV